jgi:hypothetical protein
MSFKSLRGITGGGEEILLFPRGNRRFHFIIATVLFAIFLLLIAGCSASGMKEATSQAELPSEMDCMATVDEGAGSYNVVYTGGYEAGGETVDGQAEEAENVVEAAEAGRRYLLQNARLSLEIRDVEETAAAIQLQTEKLGGYVASVEFYDLTQERRAGHLTLRIPEGKFQEALSGIKELGKPRNEHVYTDDVTMRYIDLEARLKNLEAQEQRLRELLEKAGNVEEILHIEKELWRIRSDLEVMTAEFKHLQEQVRFSILDIALQEKDPRSQVVAGGFGNFGERIGDLLALNTNRLFKGVSNLLIVAIGSLPLLIPVILLLFAAWRLAVLLKKKRPGLQKDKSDNFPS